MPHLTPEQKKAVEYWRHFERERPAREEPGPGQESVWDYPRPPRIETVGDVVRVEWADAVIAESRAALRVCETASPPTFYVPPGDVDLARLERESGTSFCEWKGLAAYFAVRVGGRTAATAAWCYPEPLAGFEALRDHLSFFPGRVDGCFVGDERVSPQPGGFYGGWITANLVGPFKGEAGSGHW